jgi:MFS family permease
MTQASAPSELTQGELGQRLEADAEIGWIGRVGLVSTCLFSTLALYGFGIALPPIARAFSSEPHAILLSQLVGSMVGFAFAVGSPLIGGLIDRFTYRTVLIISAVAFAFVGTVAGLLDNIYAILALRVLLGFTAAGGLLAGIAGIGTLPTNQRTQLLGRQGYVGGTLAICVFPLVGLLASIGWRWPFALHLVSLLVVPMALTLPKTAGKIPVKSAKSVGSAPRLAGLPPVILLCAAFVGMSGVLGAIFSPFFLIHVGIANPKLQSIPLMGEGFGSILASVAYSRIHRRLGTSRTFALALTTLGVGLVAASFSTSLLTLALALGVSASGVSLSNSNLNASVLEVARESPGRAIGLTTSALYGAQALFPFVAAEISHLTGPSSVFVAFGVSAVAIGLAYGVAGFSRRPKIA